MINREELLETLVPMETETKLRHLFGNAIKKERD